MVHNKDREAAMNKTKDQVESELNKLATLVDDFGEAMREKLWRKWDEGKSGWDDHSDPNVLDTLRRGLGKSLLEYNNGEKPEKMVDVANYSAMIWNLEVK
jgi:hypothetical protein